MSSIMSHRLSADIPLLLLSLSVTLLFAFLHIQQIGTNVFGPMMARNDPFIDCESCLGGLLQSLRPRSELVDICLDRALPSTSGHSCTYGINKP